MIGCLKTLSVPDGLYIDGEFVQAREAAREEIINPATEEPIGAVQIAGIREAQEAARAARAAFDAGPWPGMRIRERISYLERMYQALALRAQAICDLIVAEAGAVKSNARARQFDVPMKHFRHYLDTADRDPVRALAPEITPQPSGMQTLGTAFVVREPVGVVAAITPYNYPYFLNLAKVVPALLTGNTVILKPSPYTPFEAIVLAAVARDAG